MTKKEFAKLKVGDKVRIKKYDPTEKNGCGCISDMDKYVGKICTISDIGTRSCYFTIKEDPYGYYFDYRAIDMVVAGAGRENRIKQLEAEIKTLREFAEKDKCYKQNKKTGEAINDVIEGMMAGGLSREEAFELVKITCAKFMSKMFN